MFISKQGSQAQQKTIQVGQEIDIPTQVKTATGECAGKPSLPGYFAIEKSNCAKYVWCDQYGNETEFNCGEGTAFNQQYLTCDYPDNFKCSESSKFYESNSGIGTCFKVIVRLRLFPVNSESN